MDLGDSDRLLCPLVVVLVLGRRGVAAGSVEASGVVPVSPSRGGRFGVPERPPRSFLLMRSVLKRPWTVPTNSELSAPVWN